jgi:hypothetical protein
MRNAKANLTNDEEELAMMSDYRLHPAIVAAEERVRGSREHGAPASRGIRRFYRLPAERPAAYGAHRR